MEIPKEIVKIHLSICLLTRHTISRHIFNLSVSSPPQRRKSRYAELDFEVILVSLIPTELFRLRPKSLCLLVSYSDLEMFAYIYQIYSKFGCDCSVEIPDI